MILKEANLMVNLNFKLKHLKNDFLDDEFDDKNSIFIKSKKGKNFRIQILENLKQPDIRALINKCFITVPNVKYNKYRAVLGKGAISVLKLPFSIISGILFTAEKVNYFNYKDRRWCKRPIYYYET